MDFYRRMYYKLFAAMADATDAIEARQPEKAEVILVAAQQQAEEAFLSSRETEEAAR